MKKKTFLMTMLILVVMLSGCFNKKINSWKVGTYNLDVQSSKIAVCEDEYKIEYAYLIVEPIDKDIYIQTNNINSVKADVSDENGYCYYSLKMRIKLRDYEEMNVKLVDKKNKLGREDAYNFQLILDNAELTLDYDVGILVSSTIVWVRNLFNNCIINGDFKKNSDLLLCFGR